MIKHNLKKFYGFSLLEMLLVLIIVSSLIVMLVTYTTQQYKQQYRDKTVMQMQQILNAALSFYTQNGRWPTEVGTPTSTDWITLEPATHELIASKYLPAGPENTSWKSGYGQTYSTYFDTKNNFYVMTSILATNSIPNPGAIAGIIASFLPSGITTPTDPDNATPPVVGTCTPTGTCYVASSVPPPGQNLNNARSLNFGNLYKSGQCVPYPTCPTGMTAQIFAVPVQVSGTNDSNDNVYPISSFTAYAIAPTAIPPDFGNEPAACTNGLNAICVGSSKVTGGSNNYYWRVCLSVTTEKGTITTNRSISDTGNMGTIMAVTRCVPSAPNGEPNEPTGSPGFIVYD